MASYPAVELAWHRQGDDDAIVDLLYAALDPFQPVAIDSRLEPSVSTPDLEEVWRVFFRSSAERRGAATALGDTFGRALTRIVSLDVPDDGWSRRSQESLTAIQVEKIVVAPPWDQRRFPGGEISIVIDPSTGFGTGHHETTRLCLGLLQALDAAGRPAIDVGTGSGVLAIAAAKLGASRVIAVDNDPDALRNTRGNVALNGCDDRIEVVECDLAALSLRPAAIVTANLTAGVIERHAAALSRLVEDGGSLVISGFGPAESESLIPLFPALRVSKTLHEGNWTALLLQ